MTSCSSAVAIVELQVGQNGGDFEGMGKIRGTGGALLIAVRLHGVDVGAVEQSLIRFRIVFQNPLDEFVLPHHDPPHSFKAQA